MSRKRLGDILVDANMLTKEQLETALQKQKPNEKLGDVLLREGYITELQLIEVLEYQLGIPHINLSQYPIDPDILPLVPHELAKRHQVIPIRKEGNKLFVAMADPMDYFAIEELRMATGLQIIPGIATKYSLYQAITKYYDLQETYEEVMDEFSQEDNIDDMGITDDDAPIVRLVNQLIENAVAQRASDIHFDPQETDLVIRYRIDGVLRIERTLPKHMQNVLIARIKIMSHLNITESRIPQDGRIKLTINFKPIDIRISTLPSIFGEKIVMRILDISHALDRTDKLGFSPKNLTLFDQMIHQPNGIVLITGPTGSGKSSTLYAALNELNKNGVNIITVEDPVEYQLRGANQVQVNEEIGMTFANSLRSILRQDPDILMIGEIRDVETAEMAIRASLTGHLVLSTLHTNSAVAAITRLINMGIEPFLISSSLTGVVAQRLVRKVCRDCGESVEPSSREKEIFASKNIPVDTIMRGKGCESCNMSGYRGRMAIHELFPIDEHARELILQSMNNYELRRYREEMKQKSLLEDGLEKVAQGLTTTEEVLRVATIE